MLNIIDKFTNQLKQRNSIPCLLAELNLLKWLNFLVQFRAKLFQLKLNLISAFDFEIVKPCRLAELNAFPWFNFSVPWDYVKPEVETEAKLFQLELPGHLSSAVVGELRPHVEYKTRIYAENSLGRGEPGPHITVSWIVGLGLG